MSIEKFISDLATILADFQGREYSDPIDAETLMISDIGLSSIDVVILGETLDAKYQTALPFGPFLAELGQKDIQDLRIGQLAEFLNEHVK